jgi:UDP-N-acetylmuramyl pentapeptide phosphotransferase/UDP-N-acetylglucosamine-1-phosphate transferase
MSLFFILFIFSLIISLYYEKIIDFVNIYDCPDGVRKFQKNKVPCVGGLYFYVTFLIILFYYFLLSEQSDFVVKEFLIKDIKQFILIIFSITFIFFVGLYDDKYEMSSSIKTFLLLFIIFFYVYHNDEIQINHLTSSFLQTNNIIRQFKSYFLHQFVFLHYLYH